MKTINKYTLSLDHDEPGYYNAPSRLTWGKGKSIQSVITPNGRSDRTAFFKHEGVYCFLSYNTGLGYAGLTVYENGEEIGFIFCHCDSSVHETLGKNWEDKSDWWIATALYKSIAWPN